SLSLGLGPGCCSRLAWARASSRRGSRPCRPGRPCSSPECRSTGTRIRASPRSTISSRGQWPSCRRSPRFTPSRAVASRRFRARLAAPRALRPRRSVLVGAAVAGIDRIAREELEAIAARGLLRALEPLRGRRGAEVELRGREGRAERLINFSSNDYLGLAGDPRLSQALAEGASRFGVGAGASRLVCGDFAPHHELEEELARFEDAEAALLCNSGYAANTGLVAALAGPEDVVLSDALNHASLIDGCRLSR